MTTLHTVGVQPQQQVIAHQQGQQTITYQTVQAQPQASGAVVSSYNTSGARQTGYIQVVCGVVSVAIGIAAIIMDCAIAEVGSPIWSGVCFFIVAGILGIASAGNQNSCAIVAHLVMSILASLAAFQLMIILIVAALEETYSCGFYYYYYNCSSVYGRIVVDSIGCIVALVEFIVSIIAAAICCRGSCGYGTIATQQTVVHHYVPNQGNLTIMTSPQPYGQAAPVQQGYIQQPGHPQQMQGYAISPPQAYHMPPSNMAPQPASGVNQHPAVPPPYYQLEDKPGAPCRIRRCKDGLSRGGHRGRLADNR